MNVKEIMDLLLFPPVLKDLALIAIILSLVEISPLKLNPWKWLKQFIELPDRINRLEEDFNNDKAYRWRSMILSRSDRIRRGEKFSEERWNDTYETIDRYEAYCKDKELHKDETFVNGKATAAIDFLKDKYHEAIKNNDFLN